MIEEAEINVPAELAGVKMRMVKILHISTENRSSQNKLCQRANTQQGHKLEKQNSYLTKNKGFGQKIQMWKDLI